MPHNKDRAPIPPAPRRGTANAPVAAIVTLFASLGIVAVSTAMSAAPARTLAQPPHVEGVGPAVGPLVRALSETTVVLLVSSREEAARIGPNRAGGALVGSRGKFDVQIAVVRTTDEERLLRSMLLNDTICPTSACGDLAIIDLRSVGEPQPQANP